MSFSDKSLRCVDCGNEFTFTSGEQEFFVSKGLAFEPRRCPQCRRARRQERNNGNGTQRVPRQMYPAVCAACGKDTEVPFVPRMDRPIYCDACYSAIRWSSEGSRQDTASLSAHRSS